MPSVQLLTYLWASLPYIFAKSLHISATQNGRYLQKVRVILGRKLRLCDPQEGGVVSAFKHCLRPQEDPPLGPALPFRYI